MGKVKNVTDTFDKLSTDALASMSDEELTNLHQDLADRREAWLKNHANARFLEDELAYVQREHQMRRIHREAHDRYMGTLMKELDDMSREESNLPNIDFSNIDFVHLHMEYEAHHAVKNKKARC